MKNYHFPKTISCNNDSIRVKPRNEIDNSRIPICTSRKVKKISSCFPRTSNLQPSDHRKIISVPKVSCTATNTERTNFKIELYIHLQLPEGDRKMSKKNVLPELVSRTNMITEAEKSDDQPDGSLGRSDVQQGENIEADSKSQANKPEKETSKSTVRRNKSKISGENVKSEDSNSQANKPEKETSKSTVRRNKSKISGENVKSEDNSSQKTQEISEINSNDKQHAAILNPSDTLEEKTVELSDDNQEILSTKIALGNFHQKLISQVETFERRNIAKIYQEAMMTCQVGKNVTCACHLTKKTIELSMVNKTRKRRKGTPIVRCLDKKCIYTIKPTTLQYKKKQKCICDNKGQILNKVERAEKSNPTVFLCTPFEWGNFMKEQRKTPKIQNKKQKMKDLEKGKSESNVVTKPGVHPLITKVQPKIKKRGIVPKKDTREINPINTGNEVNEISEIVMHVSSEEKSQEFHEEAGEEIIDVLDLSSNKSAKDEKISQGINEEGSIEDKNRKEINGEIKEKESNEEMNKEESNEEIKKEESNEEMNKEEINEEESNEEINQNESGEEVKSEGNKKEKSERDTLEEEIKKMLGSGLQEISACCHCDSVPKLQLATLEKVDKEIQTSKEDKIDLKHEEKSLILPKKEDYGSLFVHDQKIPKTKAIEKNSPFDGNGNRDKLRSVSKKLKKEGEKVEPATLKEEPAIEKLEKQKIRSNFSMKSVKSPKKITERTSEKVPQRVIRTKSVEKVQSSHRIDKKKSKDSSSSSSKGKAKGKSVGKPAKISKDRSENVFLESNRKLRKDHLTESRKGLSRKQKDSSFKLKSKEVSSKIVEKETQTSKECIWKTESKQKTLTGFPVKSGRGIENRNEPKQKKFIENVSVKTKKTDPTNERNKIDSQSKTVKKKVEEQEKVIAMNHQDNCSIQGRTQGKSSGKGRKRINRDDSMIKSEKGNQDVTSTTEDEKKRSGTKDDRSQKSQEETLTDSEELFETKENNISDEEKSSENSSIEINEQVVEEQNISRADQNLLSSRTDLNQDSNESVGEKKMREKDHDYNVSEQEPHRKVRKMKKKRETDEINEKSERKIFEKHSLNIGNDGFAYLKTLMVIESSVEYFSER